MNTNYCINCGEIIPEGRIVCLICEQGLNTTVDDTQDVYEWLHADIDDAIDMS